MSVFERYLTVWVFLCIVIGIALGQFLPGVFQIIGGLSVAQVNLPTDQLTQVALNDSIMVIAFVPILIQVLFNSGLAYWLNRAIGEKHNVACPSAVLGASLCDNYL